MSIPCALCRRTALTCAPPVRWKAQRALFGRPVDPGGFGQCLWLRGLAGEPFGVGLVVGVEYPGPGCDCRRTTVVESAGTMARGLNDDALPSASASTSHATSTTSFRRRHDVPSGEPHLDHTSPNAAQIAGRTLGIDTCFSLDGGSHRGNQEIRCGRRPMSGLRFGSPAHRCLSASFLLSRKSSDPVHPVRSDPD